MRLLAKLKNPTSPCLEHEGATKDMLFRLSSPETATYWLRVGEFSGPEVLCVSGDYVYVTEWGKNGIYRLT